jgi:cytochrome c553
MACGVLAALVALAAPVYAQEAQEDVSTQREFIAKVGVCNQCHGAAGTPRGTNIPVIWGQREDYILNQLHDFDSGKRKVEVMKWMSETMNETERKAAAAYFAKRNWPRKATPAAAVTMPRAMAVCQACHQPDFSGGTLVPRLAGQSYEYLNEEMRRFASGERNNNPDMAQLMAGISAADRDAMAKYLSGL